MNREEMRYDLVKSLIMNADFRWNVGETKETIIPKAVSYADDVLKAMDIHPEPDIEQMKLQRGFERERIIHKLSDPALRQVNMRDGVSWLDRMAKDEALLRGFLEHE